MTNTRRSIRKIKKNKQVAESTLANKLLEGTNISILDAARLIKNAIDFKPKRNKQSDVLFCTKIINLGIKNLSVKEVSIAKGFKAYLLTKSQLRPASLHDINYLWKRLFRACPIFAKKNFCDLSLKDCETWLHKTFKAASQFNKGLRFLNTFFNYAIRQEWIEKNPIKLIEKRKIIEKEIKALSINETNALIRTSLLPKYKECKAGLGILMWAGIRPQEVQRLKWQDIDLEENIISIRSSTSKTGGSRHVEICQVLNLWLKEIKEQNDNKDYENITSKNWIKKWKALRKEAGFKVWTQDVLRHSYASYFLKYHKDINRLQMNMGHYNLELLRTRYINLHGISKVDAKKYFDINRIKQNLDYRMPRKRILNSQKP